MKLLRLAEKSSGPFVELNIDTVRDRSYPMYGEEYIYVDRKPGAHLEPKVREMLRFMLSRRGQGDVARDGKYLPLTAAVVHEQLAKLA